MSNEKLAYQRLKRLHPTAHWQRLESWTGSGIFDVNACKDNIEIWVECKVGTLRQRDNMVLAKVRPAQIAWEYERRRAGGKTFVGLMLGNMLYVLPGDLLSFLINGIDFENVQKFSVDPMQLF